MSEMHATDIVSLVSAADVHLQSGKLMNVFFVTLSLWIQVQENIYTTLDISLYTQSL